MAEISFDGVDIDEETKALLRKKYAPFPRMPKESNNVCPNYFNPDHSPLTCPGACRYCLWEGVLKEMGLL